MGQNIEAVRYFAKISYDGTEYCGWQYQKNTIVTVQQVIQEGLSKLMRDEYKILGCGRTDTGVHARGYYYHFDSDKELDIEWVEDKINRVLPPSIATHKIIAVHDNAHARFDAYERSYIYRLRITADPFDRRFAWYYPFGNLDIELMNEAARLLMTYEEFYPFCKISADVKTYICEVSKAEWTFDEKNQVYEFRIVSNRFLRGMIRLIVGMCIHLQRGRLSLADVKKVMDEQSRLVMDYSVPPQGLCLYDVKYPYIINDIYVPIGDSDATVLESISQKDSKI